MVANSCDVMHLGRAAGALMLAARSRSCRGLAASHLQAGPRPLTYHEASTLYNPVTARQRYDELTDRDLCARTVALLRGRRVNRANLGHQTMAEREPLSVIGRLELMAAGEVLARYYWHLAMLHVAAKAGRDGDRSAPPAAQALCQRQVKSDPGSAGQVLVNVATQTALGG
jgi:hypothetical protein